ncbi:MAG TPA: response regulator [Vicinamibacterales bacterium]
MPYKLLLADDSVTIQRVIELTFADEDVTVTAVGDGQQAVDRILADRPDIVLADVGMPKRDGYEVATFIKNDPALAHIPVLLLTGAFEPVDDERARSARCNGVLAKPFEPQMLIGRVKELLRGVTPSPAALMAPPAIVEPAVPVTVAPSEPDAATAVHVASPESSPTKVDEDAAEDDLRLDVESLDRQQNPAPQADGSLDDYFDRLDAAFANLTGAQPGRDGATPPRSEAGEPSTLAVRSTHGWPLVTPAAPPTDRDADGGLDPERPGLEVFGPGPELGASSSPGDDLEAAASAVALPVSDAFASLLLAEREHGAGVVHDGDVRSAVAVILPGTAVTQSFIDDVARRVIERLGDSAFRHDVAQVVSATAERLIRDEIERIKATVR